MNNELVDVLKMLFKHENANGTVNEHALCGDLRRYIVEKERQEAEAEKKARISDLERRMGNCRTILVDPEMSDLHYLFTPRLEKLEQELVALESQPV